MEEYKIRFCIITEKNGDMFIEPLKEGISIEEAVQELNWACDHLSDYDKEVSTLTLTKLAIDSNGNVIDEDDDEAGEFDGYRLDGYDIFGVRP